MSDSVAGNADVLTEIFLRLPVKPLLRFKCVCKQWLSLISNPQFYHSHTLRHHHISHPFPSALLVAPIPSSNKGDPPRCPIIHFTGFLADPSTSIFADFSFLNFTCITIKQSCNGLLLVEGREWRRHKFNSMFFVCNLVTKQSVPVFFPSPTFTFTRELVALFLAFDPSRSSHFKVISIQHRNFSSSRDILNLEIPRFSRDADGKYEIRVYSSKTNSWSDPGFCFNASILMDLALGIYCNGAIHWYIGAGNSFYFDVENQCFKTYPMPSSNFDKRKVRYFGESGGHLHMILGSLRDLIQSGFDILELKEDYSGWFLRFHVDLSPVKVAFPGLDFNVFRLFHVLSIIRQEKEEELTLVLFIDGIVMCYNFVDYTLRKLGHFERISHSYAPNVAVFQYSENLFWVGASK